MAVRSQRAPTYATVDRLACSVAHRRSVGPESRRLSDTRKLLNHLNSSTTGRAQITGTSPACSLSRRPPVERRRGSGRKNPTTAQASSSFASQSRVSGGSLVGCSSTATLRVGPGSPSRSRGAYAPRFFPVNKHFTRLSTFHAGRLSPHAPSEIGALIQLVDSYRPYGSPSRAASFTIGTPEAFLRLSLGPDRSPEAPPRTRAPRGLTTPSRQLGQGLRRPFPRLRRPVR